MSAVGPFTGAFDLMGAALNMGSTVSSMTTKEEDFQPIGRWRRFQQRRNVWHQHHASTLIQGLNLLLYKPEGLCVCLWLYSVLGRFVASVE